MFSSLSSASLQHNQQSTSFTNSLRQRKASFGIKIVLSGFTKDAQSDKLALKRRGHSYFCA